MGSLDRESRGAQSRSDEFPSIESKLRQSNNDVPLYTEINIPLPRLSASPAGASSGSPRTAAKHGHSKSLSAFPGFHSRSSSTSTTSSTESERRVRYAPRIELSMAAAGKGTKARRATIEAAIVPAAMVLSAELFTPGQGERTKKRFVMDSLEVRR
ncbi:hypothetical protein M011DRAFT_481761 [Sporormia fimetaria CBS 119925]|uniref:Uncharacterized protein n=1 Tax=Sporormia fimetaria CBS 119925 TaxID=1340428 RepID=A0A6A6UVS8_9PLEO|nr:hypothetical protein M011DRAFT_481761 [Sporormia fimetaria CBS 119925]